jgi:GntR family transcriptional repressor for pyruvate dehydrogenase complex
VAVLVAEELLQVKRGRGGGLFVRPAKSPSVDRQNLAEQRAVLRAVFDFRVAVESSCAELAALRRNAADVRRLRKLHREMGELTASNASEPTPSGTARFLALDSDFHTAIATAARSPQLAEAMAQGRLNMFRPVGGIFNRLEDNADHLHEDVIDAIEAKDGELARVLMRRHIEGTRATVEAWLRP